MQQHAPAIKINPHSELAQRLKEAARSQRPVRVDIGETIYSVAADAETAAPLPTPTPKQVAATVAAITRASGSWAGLIDADAFKAYLQQRRTTANRPSLRL